MVKRFIGITFITLGLAGGSAAVFLPAVAGAAPAAVYMHSAKPDVYMHS